MEAKQIVNSELTNKYGYAILADAVGITFYKEDSATLSTELLDIMSDRDLPCKEDFSIIINNDDISFHLGDAKIVTLSRDELELMLKLSHDTEP